MIVVSLLLILVAVVLLVFGLSGGSSALLIGSIAVSLLAAAALVIGARQAANMRRAALGEPTGPGADEPEYEPAMAGAYTAGAPASDFDARDRGPGRSTPPSFADAPTDPGYAPADYAPPADTEPHVDFGPDPTFADSPHATDEGLASPRQDKARVASPDDAAAALAADQAYRNAAAGVPPGLHYPAGPDPDAGVPPGVHYPSGPAPDAGFPDPDAHAPADEFGEPDEDDPDDEPLPQAVSPADLVRVARLTAEVLVVDGRPRYHLADCPHLVGRLTEPLPVAEAVELGFSPCGLCRPVDRLVAQASHR